MMTDIHNLQAFALYMQKTDIKFDLYSVTKEMEKQVNDIFVLDSFLSFSILCGLSNPFFFCPVLWICWLGFTLIVVP